jgi:enoyl-CoA hydratase
MTIQFRVIDDVAQITIDDGKANAASLAMLIALSAALDRAEREAQATVIAGRAGMFSAGYDLKTLREGSGADRDAMLSLGAAVSTRLFAFPQPLVVASTGHSLALGAVWLLCADTRIGTRGDYKYALNETAIGMVLPDYAIAPARFRLNPTHLIPAALQSRVYDPEGAVQAGFLDQIEDDAVGVALAKAQELSRLPADAYAGTKRALRLSAAAGAQTF